MVILNSINQHRSKDNDSDPSITEIGGLDMSANDMHKRRHASDKDDLKKCLVQSNSVKAFLDGFCAYDPAVQAQNAAALKDVYASYARFCQYPPKETVDNMKGLA